VVLVVIFPYQLVVAQLVQEGAYRLPQVLQQPILLLGGLLR